ncbi:MAG: alpha/beta fold hydrolase [Nakamurella sp.]
MAWVSGERDQLRITLSTGDRWAALRRTDLCIPWREISSVERVAEPFRLVHGLRAPGLALPWRTKIGTWRSTGRKTFAVTHAGAPGIRILLHGNGFAEILVSLPEPDAAIKTIRAGISNPHTGEPVERLLTFRSAGTELAGTALLPGAGEPRIAAAVIVTGSGKLDRNGSDRRARIDVSRQLANSLLAHGIATLRYDKRGVAASGGDYYRTGLQDNIDDAIAAAETLAQQPECAGIPLLAIGHSEGAMIVTSLAAGSATRLGGVVLLAGPASTGEQTLQWQAARIAPTLPTPVRLILRLLHTDPVQRQRTFSKKIRETKQDSMRMGGVRINARWFRELLDFDPVPLLSAITVPVLAITGDKDLQVDPADLDIIAATVPGPVSTNRMTNLTHILRLDPAEPTLGAYRKLIRQPVAPAVLQTVAEWIEHIADADSELRRPAAAGRPRPADIAPR